MIIFRKSHNTNGANMYIVFNTLNPLIVYLVTDDGSEATQWLTNNGGKSTAIKLRS